MPNGHQWTTEGPNILSEDNLSRIKWALTEDWLGGIHLYYSAGCSGDPVAFRTYDAFLSHVHNARAGDLFILWSVAEMRRRGQLLADCNYEHGTTRDSLLSADGLDRVRRYLSEAGLNEILSLSRAGDQEPEAIWADLDGSGWEPLLEAARRAAVPGGALRILPMTRIDHAEFYFIKAKRPDELGRVPTGGAY